MNQSIKVYIKGKLTFLKIWYNRIIKIKTKWKRPKKLCEGKADSLTKIIKTYIHIPKRINHKKSNHTQRITQTTPVKEIRK